MIISVEERIKMVEENRLESSDLDPLTRYELYSIIWYMRGFLKNEIKKRRNKS